MRPSMSAYDQDFERSKNGDNMRKAMEEVVEAGEEGESPYRRREKKRGDNRKRGTMQGAGGPSHEQDTDFEEDADFNVRRQQQRRAERAKRIKKVGREGFFEVLVADKRARNMVVPAETWSVSRLQLGV